MDEYQNELDKWRDLFKETDPATQQSADGLIQKAAYMHALCRQLEEALRQSGAIKIHPEHPDIQKPIPALREYSRACESYANIVNKLNSMRIKNIVEDDDELKDYED